MAADQQLKTLFKVVSDLKAANGKPREYVAIGAEITRRKQAEMSAIRLATIVESSDDAIIGKDLNGVVTSWNQGAEKIFGFTAEEMVGVSIMRLIPADRQEEETQILEQIRRGEKVEHFETLRKTRDGRLINVSVTASPIKEATGRVIGVSKVARDITERKRTERALQSSEARLSFALQISQIGAWELSLLDGTANRTLIHDRIFGYDQLLPLWTYGMFLEHVLPRDRGEIDRKFREATAAHANWNFECRIRRADGEVRWIWAAGGHEQDSGGQVVRMSGIVQDITDRKRIELAAAQLRDIVEYSDDAIMGKDLHGDVTSWNAAAERLFGFTSGEMIGQPISWIVPSGLQLQEKEILRRIERGESIKSLDTQRLHKDGHTIPISVTVSPIKDATGKIVGASKVARNISERKRTEDEIRQLNQNLECRVRERTAELEAANRALRASEEQLRTLAHWAVQTQEVERARLAVALHDNITQPLCAIQAHAQTLFNELPDRVAGAKREALKLREMASQAALEAERISRNLRPGVLEILGLVSVLRAVSEEFEDRTGVNVRLNCPPLTAPLPAAVDLALYRILQLALENVEQHAGARHVMVGLEQTADSIQLTVNDDGIGFEPGQPGKAEEISGLGLVRMRERAIAVGGDLKVKSTLHCGTEIEARIALPQAT